MSLAELAGMRNLGNASATMLASVGITTPQQLQELGAVEAYARLKLAGKRVSLVMAYAIEGALLDHTWSDLPQELRDDIKRRCLERIKSCKL